MVRKSKRIASKQQQQQQQQRRPVPVPQQSNSIMGGVRKKGMSKAGGMFDAEQHASSVHDVDVDALRAESNAGGKVEISVAKYVELLQKSIDVPQPQRASYVTDCAIDGEAFVDHARLAIKFQVVVLTDDWCQVPLLSNSLSILSHSVGGGPQARAAAAAGDNDSGSDDDVNAGSEAITQGWIGVHHSSVCLSTHGAGTCTVSFDVLASCSERGTASGRTRDLSVDIPQSVHNSLRLRIAEDNLQVKVEPSLTLSGERLQTVRDGVTHVHCEFPPTTAISVHWTPRVEEVELPEPVEVEKQKILVTVEQQILHSIGEGVLGTTATLQYKIVHGSRSAFEVLIPAAVRVVDVSGIAMKRWECSKLLPGTDDTAGVGDGNGDGDAAIPMVGALESSKPAEAEHVLKVWLEYGMEGNYSLTVNTEVVMESTSCEVTLPVFRCKDIDRQKGYVGVCARTNVEINEVSKRLVGKVDIAELPAVLSRRAPNSILHAYKFLVSRYRVVLDVKKHDDVGVLIAVVDEAWFTATVSSGKLLHNVRLKVRNTQKQYLRAKLPSADCEIWSCIVAGDAVKPAMDKNGFVMLPLRKTSSQSTDNEAFWVELDFLREMQPMGKRGALSITFARFDVPINHMFASVYVPEDAKYGEFSGDLKEVARFSKALPSVTETRARAEGASAPSMRGRKANMAPRQQQQVQMQQQMMMPPQLQQSNIMNANLMDNIFNDDDDDDIFAGQVGSGGGIKSKSNKGVRPVMVAAVHVGRRFMFERLLVNNESFTVKVEYQRVTKSFWKRRRVGWSKPHIVAVCVLVAMLAYFVAVYRGSSLNVLAFVDAGADGESGA